MEYCEMCRVVEIRKGDKYCDGCANVIAEYLYAAYWDELAEEYEEAIASQEGLY